MSGPEIYIALPVFRGAEVVAETLRSIRDQTFTNYRVMISVDGNDEESAKVCRPFTSDSRFQLLIQSRRLDWVGNMNWLIERCDCPYFCYWQQDDLTATNYLEKLHSELLSHSDVAIAYSDVQWFGARFGRDSTPDIIGSAPSRVLQSIEAIRFEVLRGLMRSEWLPRHEAIPVTVDESCQAEFVFLTKMAARGAFRRVADTMYFKRAHSQNTFARWHDWPPFRRRRGWIDAGVGFLQVAREVFPDPRHLRRLLTTILDRLTISRGTRGFFYQPDSDSLPELTRFIRDFMARSPLESVPVEPAGTFEATTAAFFAPVHPNIEAALDAIAQGVRTRRELGERLRREGRLNLAIQSSGEVESLLESGWSSLETWGVWNDGDEATLCLPPARKGEKLRVRLTGSHFADPRQPANKPVHIGWRLGGNGPVQTTTVRAGEQTTVQLAIPADGNSGVPCERLHLQFPNAVFLPDTGITDQRKVGFGLRQIEIVADGSTG